MSTNTDVPPLSLEEMIKLCPAFEQSFRMYSNTQKSSSTGATGEITETSKTPEKQTIGPTGSDSSKKPTSLTTALGKMPSVKLLQVGDLDNVAMSLPGAHYVWYFYDTSSASSSLNKVWADAQGKYKNLGFNKFDYAKNKQLADSLGCDQAPSFAFWNLSTLAFVCINPTVKELDYLLRVWST